MIKNAPTIFWDVIVPRHIFTYSGGISAIHRRRPRSPMRIVFRNRTRLRQFLKMNPNTRKILIDQGNIMRIAQHVNLFAQ